MCRQWRLTLELGWNRCAEACRHEVYSCGACKWQLRARRTHERLRTQHAPCWRPSGPLTRCWASPRLQMGLPSACLLAPKLRCWPRRASGSALSAPERLWPVLSGTPPRRCSAPRTLLALSLIVAGVRSAHHRATGTLPRWVLLRRVWTRGLRAAARQTPSLRSTRPDSPREAARGALARLRPPPARPAAPGTSPGAAPTPPATTARRPRYRTRSRGRGGGGAGPGSSAAATAPRRCAAATGTAPRDLPSESNRGR